MSKRKTMFRNGNKIWAWMLIGIFITTLIGNAFILQYQVKQNKELGKENKAMSTDNDKRLAVLEEQIKTLINGQKEINAKLDRALRRQ